MSFKVQPRFIETQVVLPMVFGGSGSCAQTKNFEPFDFQGNCPEEFAQKSHEQKTLITCQYTGCLVGILVMVYYKS